MIRFFYTIETKITKTKAVFFLDVEASGRACTPAKTHNQPTRRLPRTSGEQGHATRAGSGVGKDVGVCWF